MSSSTKELKGHEILHPEILIPILFHLPDLESLDNYLRASPAAFRVFDDKIFSATIFETILENGTTHKYSAALIRIIALIRASALPSTVYNYDTFEKFETFKKFVVHETTPHRNNSAGKPDWEHPAICLPKDLSPSILRGILVSSRRIQHLAFGCLDFYLARFRPIRPFHSAGYSYDRPYASEDIEDFDVSPWAKKVDNVELFYPVQDIGPPSWLEQQRVLRAYWRMQLLREIKAEMLASRIIFLRECRIWLNDDDDDDDNLDAYILDTEVMPFDHIHPRDLHLVLLLEWDQESGQDTVLEDELLESVRQYNQEVSEVISETKYWALRKEWEGFPVPGTIDDCVCLDKTYTSHTWRFFAELSGDTGGFSYYNTHRPPLEAVEFTPFRRLGFAIWSNARLEAYGLLNPSKRRMGGPYIEAWTSLLSEAEKVEREEELERRLVDMLEGERRANFPHMTFDAFRIQFDP